MTFLLKDPAAVLDYAVDWGAEYLSGDLLADSDWSVSPVEPGGAGIVGSQFDLLVATALVKHYGEGEQRRITRPVAGSVRVSVDGAEQASAWTLDPLGVVRFDVARDADIGFR